MAAFGVFDVTKRTAFATVRNNTSGPIVAEFKPTKRTAFASVRNTTSRPLFAVFTPTKRTASAYVRNNPSGPIVALFGPTKRRAFVRIINNTDEHVVGVSVVHKYSSVYKHQHQWGIGPVGTTQDRMEVEYNTGFLTTGVDWWVVTWYSADGKTLYYSDPHNFRGFVDWLEGLAPGAIDATAGLVAGLVASPTGPGAVAAAVGAAAVAKTTTDALFSSESTEGFKMHTLREEDAGEDTFIIINRDRTITFKSKSGNSDTVSSSRPAP